MTRKQEYVAYLKSDHWKAMRQHCLDYAGGKCALCGRERFLQAHHKFYRQSFYDTRLGDLLALCVYCHSKHHGKTVEIPDAWLKQELVQFRREQRKSVKKPKPKWVKAMLDKAARNRSKRQLQKQSESDYALRAFRERLNIIVKG